MVPQSHGFLHTVMVNMHIQTLLNNPKHRLFIEAIQHKRDSSSRSNYYSHNAQARSGYLRSAANSPSMWEALAETDRHNDNLWLNTNFNISIKWKELDYYQMMLEDLQKKMCLHVLLDSPCWYCSTKNPTENHFVKPITFLLQQVLIDTISWRQNGENTMLHFLFHKQIIVQSLFFLSWMCRIK